MNLFLLYRWKNHAKFLKDFQSHRGSHLVSPGAEARHGDSRVPAGKPQCIYPDPWPSAGKESTCNGGDPGFDSWVGKTPWRRDGLPIPAFLGFPHGSDDKESTCNAGDLGSVPWVGKNPWRSEWQPTPVFLPGGSHGQRNLVGYSPWGAQRAGPITDKVVNNWATKHSTHGPLGRCRMLDPWQ